MQLYEFVDGGGKSLGTIAAELKVDEDLLRHYNKWLKRGNVPRDKMYTVIIPGVEIPQGVIARENRPRENDGGAKVVRNDLKKKDFSANQERYPIIEKKNKDNSRLVMVNGISGVVAKAGEDIVKLSNIGEISLKKFLKFNDIDVSHEVKVGQVYYFKRKGNKAKEYYHTVYPDENTWMISQKYGIKEKKLLRKNRFRKDDATIKPGLVLWLRYIRPDDYPVEYAFYPKDTPSSAVVDQVVTSAGPSGKEDRSSAGIEEEEINREKEEGPVTDLRTEAETDNKRRIDDAYEDPGDDAVNRQLETGGRQAEWPAPEEQPLFHLVEKDETLYSIARQYGVSIDSLFAINEIDRDATIRIGQKIYLKDPFREELGWYQKEKSVAKEKNSYMIYSVRKGDTMYSISKKFDVSLEDIMKWNNKSDYSLKEGEQLKINKRKN